MNIEAKREGAFDLVTQSSESQGAVSIQCEESEKSHTLQGIRISCDFRNSLELGQNVDPEEAFYLDEERLKVYENGPINDKLRIDLGYDIDKMLQKTKEESKKQE